MATQIKICGIDTAANAEVAQGAGAQALGLVFATASARRLSVERAQAIAQCVRGQVLLVGMFVDQAASYVAEVQASLKLDVLQFHGAETAAYCDSFGVPYIKAVRAGIDAPEQIASDYARAWGWLLDTATATSFGGSGQSFDLALWPRQVPGPWMLAGGLTADSVGSAIAAVQPWYVDVSSAVEGSKRGVKDPQRIVSFIEAVHAADAKLAALQAQSPLQ